MGRPPSVSQDKFIIRLPDGMRERIKAAADANGRTMTAEIVWRLETSLDPTVKVLPDQKIHDMMITDMNEMVHAIWGRLEQIDERLGIDTRPKAAAKPKRKKG